MFEILTVRQLTQKAGITHSHFTYLFNIAGKVPDSLYHRIPKEMVPHGKHNCAKFEWDVEGLKNWYREYTAEYPVKSDDLVKVHLGTLYMPKQLHDKIMAEFTSQKIKHFRSFLVNTIFQQRYPDGT